MQENVGGRHGWRQLTVTKRDAMAKRDGQRTRKVGLTSCEGGIGQQASKVAAGNFKDSGQKVVLIKIKKKLNSLSG